MDEVNVHVEVKINPTESEEKVRRAVESVLGIIPMQLKPLNNGGLLVADGKELEPLTKLRNLLRRERIRNAARSVLFGGLNENVIIFCLNKQVAYTGHVSFCKEVVESPLGPIRVQIECDNARELINWLTPKMM